jgi:hypothetical protein
MSSEVSAYGGFESTPASVGGRRRRSRRARRGGGDPVPVAAPPPVKGTGGVLQEAGFDLKKLGGLEGGRRKRSTAKKIANELKRVAKKAKKLTMKLMKMRRRK